MKEKQCSIRDIAQAANVSPATVSRVFAENGYVSQETRELVLAAARERGYTPKQYQRRTAHNRGEMLVGLVVADLHNPFFQKMIDFYRRRLLGQPRPRRLGRNFALWKI